MNISFLLNDDVLVEGFLKWNKLHRDSISIYNSIEMFILGLDRQTDVIIASDRFFDYEGLCEFTEAAHHRNPSARKFLLLSNHHNPELQASILKTSLASDWVVIRPGNSSSSIVDQLSSYIFGESGSGNNRPNQIIQFMGSTPNIGTTVAAFGTAAQMATRTNKSVVYICLNLKSSKIHRYLGVDEPEHTLEGIRAELKSLSLSSDRLRQHALRIRDQPNLDVIFGNMSREQAEFYSLNDIDCLLQVASRAYDYIIVDTNAYWDNAATIATMMSAGTRLMVTTDQLGHFQEDLKRWLRALSPVFGLSSKSFDLLITQKGGKHSSTSYSHRDIRRETEMHKLGEIYKWNEIDTLLNQGRLWEAISSPSLLQNDLIKIARTILSLYGDPVLELAERRTWLQHVQGLVKPWGRRIKFD